MQHFVASALTLFLLVVSAGAGASTYDVRDFGAKGDRGNDDQAGIQAAVDACGAGGGGTVYFPAGDYLSSTIRLRSNVRVRLDAGATLWVNASPEGYEDPQRGHLFVAEDAEHISIVGPGVINGQGTKDMGRRPGDVGERAAFRTGVLLFERCRHVAIRDLTILYSDAWTLHFKLCETVFIDGVTILNNYWRTNLDGIDPNSCRDVSFRDIQVRSGSGILIQGMRESPIENLSIENLSFRVTRADDYAERKKPVGGRRTTSDERDTLYARQPSYVTLAYVKGLAVDNVRVTIAEEAFQKYERAAFSGHAIEDGAIRGVYRSPAGEGGALPALTLDGCRGVSVKDCTAIPDSGDDSATKP